MKEKTFDELADQVVQAIPDIKRQMNKLGCSEEVKLSVLKGMLLSFGGYKATDDNS